MISQIFSEDGTFKEKAKSALEMLVLLTGADWVTFRLPNEPIPGLHLAAAAGPAALQYPPLQVITESESLSTAAFKERRTIVTDDYTICPTASPIIIAMGMKSQVFVPVRSGENTLGLLTVISKRKNAFDAGTVELLTFVVERFGVLVENALLHDESEKTREDLQVLAEALSNSNKMIHDSNMMLEERVNIRTQELEAARERAMRSEKLAIIGQLSGGIAHDLRNPLGAIKNAAYLTKRRFNSTEILENKESIVNLLELIDGEIGRAEDVITNLLSYGSNREITSTEIQIEDVIRNSLAGFVLEEDVSLITDTKPGLPSILGDASQLIRVLQNLVLNAQDAIQDSEQAEGCISIKAQRKDGSLEIVVADNGSGISPENLDKIFDPLYTAKSHGTGLGLAICQEIINKHNGTISVESEDGVGTSFRISIPFVANQANQTDQPGVA
ncbi:MAG: GAF domain-containing protein [Chloroflexi bacterium]|nr:GAF domain-containing protein [Chloroflexota bacterium]